MNSGKKTLLRARWVAPMGAPLIGDGAVVFEGGKIVAVGDASELCREHRDAEQIDLAESVLLPGLINSHVHLELSDLGRLPSSLPLPPGEGRGEGGRPRQVAHPEGEPALTPALSRREREPEWRAPLADWLIEVIKRSPQSEDTSRVRTAVDTGVSQCLRFGVTTIGDVSRQASLTRPLLRNSPLRVISFGEIQAMATRRGLLDARLQAASDRTYENDHLTIGVSPHAPYSVEPIGFERSLATKLPLATHLAESPDEAAFLADHAGPFRNLWEFLNAWDENVPRFAGGPIRFAKSLGLLDRPTVLAHVNYCDDAELSLLATGVASVVYCPRTHAYFGHPPHRWRDMLAAGVNVALGTDSTASSPDLNLVDDLRLVRQIAGDLTPDELWELVTIRAAHALGLQGEVGTLTLGKRADVVSFPVANSPDPLDTLLREPILPAGVWISGRQVN